MDVNIVIWLWSFMASLSKSK